MAGAIGKEKARLRAERTDDSSMVFRALNRIEELKKSKASSGKTKLTKAILPGELMNATARTMLMTGEHDPFMTTLLSAVGLTGKIPGAVTGAEKQKAKIDELKAKKAAVNSGAVSEGGASQIFSNVANVAGIASKTSAGLYAAGMGAKLAGADAISKTLFSAGKIGFQHNPFATGSFLTTKASAASNVAAAKAGEAIGSDYNPAALPGYLMGKTGTAVTGLGNVLNEFGMSSAGGAVTAAGKGIGGMAGALHGLDPMLGSVLGMVTMLATTMGSQKVIGKIGRLGGANKLFNTGKSIRINLPNGLKEAEKYYLGRGVENIHNLYMATGAYQGSYEGLSISLGLLQLKAVSILPAIYEVLAGKDEKARVGGNLAQNEHQSKFGFNKSNASFDEIYTDQKLSFGGKLNKIGVGLEETLLKIGAVTNLMNWMSIKNNPISLLMRMKEDNTLSEAKKTVAKQFNMSIEQISVLNTNFAQSVQRGQTTEEKILLAVMHIGEIIRLEAMQKKRAGGLNMMGAMADAYDRKKLKNEQDPEELVDSIAEFIGHVPVLGPILGLSLLGMKLPGKTWGGVKNIASKTWGSFTTKWLDNESNKKVNIASAKSPQELMALYIGRTFPDRFEKLLDKAHDRNSFIKEIAKKLGVGEDKLQDTTSGAKWIVEMGKMMTATQLDKSLGVKASAFAKGKWAELMKGSSWYTRLLGGYKSKKDIRKKVEDSKNSIFGSYFGAGASNSRSADAAQQQLIQSRLDQEAIDRDKKKTAALTFIQENLEDIKKCINCNGSGPSSNDNNDGSWLAGAAGALGLTALWGKLKLLSKKLIPNLAKAKKGFRRTKGALGKTRMFLRPFIPMFRLLGGAFIAFELLYYWDDIIDWGKEKYKNLKKGEWSQLFGMADKDGKDIRKDAWGLGGTASSVVWNVASMAALVFPNPFTLGFAALAGVWHYGDKMWAYGKQKLIDWGLVDPDKVKAPDPAKVKSRTERSTLANITTVEANGGKVPPGIHDRGNQTTLVSVDGKKLYTATGAFTDPFGNQNQALIRNKNGSLILNPAWHAKKTAESIGKKYETVTPQKINEKDNISFMLDPKVQRLLNELKAEADIDKNGSLDSAEEIKEAIRLLKENNKMVVEYINMGYESQKLIAGHLNGIAQTFGVGQLEVIKATKELSFNLGNSTSFTTLKPLGE